MFKWFGDKSMEYNRDNDNDFREEEKKTEFTMRVVLQNSNRKLNTRLFMPFLQAKE